MWPLWMTFYFCVFIKCLGKSTGNKNCERTNCDGDQADENKTNHRRGMHVSVEERF